VGHLDDGRHNGAVIFVGGNVAHKGLVDLELVNAEFFQIAQ